MYDLVQALDPVAMAVVVAVVTIYCLIRKMRARARTVLLFLVVGVVAVAARLQNLYREQTHWWTEENPLIIGSFVVSIVVLLITLVVTISHFEARGRRSHP